MILMMYVLFIGTITLLAGATGFAATSGSANSTARLAKESGLSLLLKLARALPVIMSLVGVSVGAFVVLDLGRLNLLCLRGGEKVVDVDPSKEAGEFHIIKMTDGI
jgi:hypothetical protein